MGSHSGCYGIWVSGPEDLNSPDEWAWGYNRMTTVKGLFTAGNGVGASGPLLSTGPRGGSYCASNDPVGASLTCSLESRS